MIDELRIRNLALIGSASLRFSQGLTVLTGETGAGKTALLSGMGLAIGARGDAGAVRDGQREASVEALFDVGEEVLAQLAELGIEADDGQVLVRRTVSQDGRSKCYVNDQMATVKGLAATVGATVDLLGQHQHQALLSPSNHVGYLDRWSWQSVSGPLERYRGRLAAYRACQQELEQARERLEVSDYQLDQARFICQQIGAVKPGATEYDELEQQLPILRNGEQLVGGANDALQALRGDSGAEALLSQAYAGLARNSGVDPRLDALAARLDAQQVELSDIASALRAYRDEVEFDPLALQQALDRLGELDALVRTYGPTYQAMLDRWSEAQQLVESSVSGADALEQLQAACERARAELEQAAEELAQARADAATRFCAQLAGEVEQLAMQGARFEIAAKPLGLDAWNATGSFSYEIMYAPASDLQPRPLSKIASGGELSRVMLAIECMAAGTQSPKTLVFDEVDAGLGGATAQAVAAKLAQLAQVHQVIAVTHLASIAAVADAHLLVSKTTSSEGSFTTISPIEGDERVAEIARMLSGSTDEAALSHARAMLEG